MCRKMIVMVLSAAAMCWTACSKNDKSSSPDWGSIEGRVTADGVGVPGVNIGVTPYVFSEGGAKIENSFEPVTTASDGDYHIDILPGSYKISFDVTYLGEHLFTSRYPVDVESGQNVIIDVELKDPAPSNLLVREDNATVKLAFESGYAAHSHKIYRSVADQDDYILIATIDSYYGYGTITYTDTPPAIQSYDYRVTAVSDGGESQPSNTARIDFSGAISPPIGLLARDQIARISLTWSSRSGALQYNIYRSSNQSDWNLRGSTSALTFADTPGVYGIYSYRLTAVSRYGIESAPGVPVSVNYDGRLDAPEGLTVVDRGSSVYLIWESLEQAVAYNIYRSSTAEGIYTRIDSTLEIRYSDQPVSYGEYYYKISAIGPNGLESELSIFVSIVFDGVLDPPRSVYVQDQGLTLQVHWDQVSWAGAYVLYRSDDGGTTYSQIARIPPTVSQYTDMPPSAGTYYYKVAVETYDGVLGPLSGPAMIVYSANLFAPQGVYAQSMGLYVSVSWNLVTGASAYSIYRATEISGDYVEIEDLIQYPTFHDEPPTAGPYYYRVQAFDYHGHRSAMSFYAYVYFPNQPLTPAIVSISDNGHNIWLHWSVSGLFDSSLVYRAGAFDGPYLPQLWVSGTSCYDWPSAAGHYFYKVQVIYHGVTSELSSSVHIYFLGIFDPPSNIYGFDAGSSVQLGWTSVDDAASYEVYRGTSPDSMALNQTVYTNSATDTPPGAGDYYYAVLARTRGGLASPLCSPVLVHFTP